MKVMISQAMKGKTEQEILQIREKARLVIEKRGYEFVNTWFQCDDLSDENLKYHGVIQKPLYYLAKSLEIMSKCHAVYFCKDWENARGCRIEHEATKAYGLDIIYEQEN